MAYTSFTPYQTKVSQVDKQYITINDSSNFLVGSTGVVLHAFDDEHKTIVSTVEVISKKDSKAVLKYRTFNGLKQDALPSYSIAPQAGDTIILNYLYNRAMAIVPNKETLQSVTTKFNSMDWIHPDILGSKLAIDYTTTPSKEEFQQECQQDGFSILFFAIEDKGYFVDCNSFKVLIKADIAQPSQEPAVVPFYTRIAKEIKGRVFGIMGKGIGNYTTYYKALLGLK
jgi:hypothetical protein